MSLFKRLFTRKSKQPDKLSSGFIEDSISLFTPFSGNAYENDIYRSAVDAIAKNAAKLKATHTTNDIKLNMLLQTQPNPYMNAYDMFYKIVTHYFLYNNAFAYLERDNKGNVLGIYPLKASHINFLHDGNGSLFCHFLFSNGKEVTLPYADIIHLRRNFNDNELLGDSNTALIPALELAHTQNEGIISGIKNSANIRGILSFSHILSPDKLEEAKEAFMASYLQMSNNGGVIALDTKATYTPINNRPYVIDDKQMSAIKSKIYTYLGISEKIVSADYNEDEWAAFYESVIEPLATQMSLEFTRKIFNEREQEFGNKILFESGRLQFASNTTKINLIKEIMPLGLLTINQALEILNLPSVEDGDKRLQTLNVVDASKANEYQLGVENVEGT